MTKEIVLTNGAVALVDDEDYERLSRVRWCQKLGYAQGSLDGKSISMHAAILDCPPGLERDHINHNRLDNRRCNLRLVTHAENCRNMRKRKRTSSSFWGVTKRKYCRINKWMAKLRIGKRSVHIGVFATEEEAARAYDLVARKHFGNAAHINFPE